MVEASDSEPALSRRTTTFSHPSGREIHVASNPEQAETLRSALSKQQGDNSFDVFLKGSDEHVKALQEAQEYHEQRRNELRETHGDAWKDFERVHVELDHLSSELNNISTQGVALDANFDRFGYSAHIRTLDDDSASMSTLSRKTSRSEPNAQTVGEPIKLWRRPIVRQYFHKGFIWRASEEAEVSSMELFVDLIFVGLVAIEGDAASEEPNAQTFLRFCITLIPSYQLWSSVTTVNAWFVSNDLFGRFCIVVIIACLVGYSTNINGALEETYTPLVAYYLAGRIFNVLYYMLLIFLIPMLRYFFVMASTVILIPAALWITSIHVEYPARLGLIWPAIILDVYGNGLIVPLHRWSQRLEASRFAWIAKYAQFYPAINIEHRTERMNAFVSLVIGYSVVGLLYQSNQVDGVDAFFGKAILSLIIAVCFSLIYFEIDSTNLQQHAIRRHAGAYTIWQNSHLPFVLGFVLASGALSKLVVARDCQNAPLEVLADASAAKSDEEISEGLRWFFCGGIGVALLCTVAISASHLHKRLPGLRFAKRYRLMIRCICAVVIITLPTAGDRLNSLELIATVAGMLVVSLFVELWGCTDSERGSFWVDNKRCKYAAECKLGKKDIEALRKGEVSGVEDLAQREKKREKKKETFGACY